MSVLVSGAHWPLLSDLLDVGKINEKEEEK